MYFSYTERESAQERPLLSACYSHDLSNCAPCQLAGKYGVATV